VIMLKKESTMRIVAKFRIPLSLLLGALVTRVTLASPPPTSVIHVPGDFPTIQEAIDAAPEGSEILVAPGSYKGPSIPISISTAKRSS